MKKRRLSLEGEQNVALNEMYITRRQIHISSIRDSDFSTNSAVEEGSDCAQPFSKKRRDEFYIADIDTFSSSSSCVAWENANKLTPIITIKAEALVQSNVLNFSDACGSLNNGKNYVSRNLYKTTNALTSSVEHPDVSESSSEDHESESFKKLDENGLVRRSESITSKFRDGLQIISPASKSDIASKRSDVLSPDKVRKSFRVLSRLNESEVNSIGFGR